MLMLILWMFITFSMLLEMYCYFYDDPISYYIMGHIDLYNGFMSTYKIWLPFIIFTFLDMDIKKIFLIILVFSLYIFFTCSFNLTAMTYMRGYWCDDVLYFHFFWWNKMTMLSLLYYKFVFLGVVDYILMKN